MKFLQEAISLCPTNQRMVQAEWDYMALGTWIFHQAKVLAAETSPRKFCAQSSKFA